MLEKFKEDKRDGLVLGVFWSIVASIILLGLLALGILALLSSTSTDPCTRIANDLVGYVKDNEKEATLRLQAYETCVQYRDVHRAEEEIRCEETTTP